MTEPTITTDNTQRPLNIAQQCHENDIAKLVLVHEPGLEALIGSLHASGSLFEKPVNIQKARDDHAHFRRAMEHKGVKVLSVREILALHCEDNLRYRVALEELALEVLQYKLIKKHHQPSSSSSSSTVADQQHNTPHSTHGIITPVSPPPPATNSGSENNTPTNHLNRPSSPSSGQQQQACNGSGSGNGGAPPSQFNLTKVQKHLLSDDYKRECLARMGTNDLIDLIMLGPTCGLAASHSNTPLRLDNLQMKPLLNLTFTRDQQIVTNKGLVLMNMGSIQRARETRIMNFCFNKLSVPILGKIEAPGTCEGGDFISGGADLCFIGTGLRTNQHAIDQFLENDWFGTRRVAVCRDLFDCDQQRMHLDTVFNVCSHNCVVMLDTMIGEQSPIRRLVTEYTQVINEQTGKKEYIVTRKDVELSRYVQEEGYHIIPITQEQQSAYGINFLNLGNGFLIGADESTARTILKSEHFDGDVQVIDFTGMISMFGCLHCCSQVLQRQPAPVNFKHHQAIEPTTVQRADVLVKHAATTTAGLCQNLLLVSPSYYDPTSVVEPKHQHHVPNVLHAALAQQEDIENSSRSRPLNPDNLHHNDESSNQERTLSQAKEQLQQQESPSRTRSFVHSVPNILNADATADKSLNLAFSHLDGVLNVHQVNTFLFAQYTNDKNRNSVFAGHSLTSINGKAIFYPGADRKLGLTELIERLYSKENVLNLDQQNDLGNVSFHGGNIVFDRCNSKAFVARVPETGLNQESIDAIAQSMGAIGVSTHVFNVKKQDGTCTQFVDNNTNAYLFIGSKFALLCPEMIEESELQELRSLVSNNGQRTIVDITRDQQQNFAISGVVEVAGSEMKPILIVSESAWSTLREEQQQQLFGFAHRVETVELGAIEDIQGGSLNDMVVTLF